MKSLPTLLITIASLLGITHADFGDYADLSFECPALTTCPTICVADLRDCPTECPDDESFLCPDGSCALNELECNSLATNQCASNSCGYPLACPKTVLEYQKCFDEYNSFYDLANGCPTSVNPAPTISWTLPGFIVFYTWIGVVTLAVLGWCAINRCLRPSKSYTKPLLAAVGGRRKSSYPVLDVSNKGGFIDGWEQTAYCKSFVGQFIYVLVIVTLIGFHALLATTCAFYYAQQAGRYGEYGINPFENDQQALVAFELVWLVGFFWSLVFKWPASIQALFLRRCDFDKATSIAVFCPSPPLGSNTASSKNCAVVFLGAILECVLKCSNAVMRGIFGGDHAGIGSQVFCKVQVDGNTGVRFIYYQMRRFNYDEESQGFVPTSYTVGNTLGDFISCKDGLSQSEVQERHSSVGPNKIHLPKPSYVKSVLQEFNKVFYLYQMYIIWTWLNFNYFPMGIVNLCIFVSGGVGVAFVRWRNEKQLYALSLTEGEVTVRRDGNLKSISQSDLAPGDVMLVEPGIAYCDLILIEGSQNGVLVDESALTGEATPVGKTVVDVNDSACLYNPKDHNKQTIAAGTTVLETGEASLTAVVINTGSNTSKGKLLRDIVHRKRAMFKFDVEIQIVFMILAVIAIINAVIMLKVILGGEPFAYSFFFAGYIVYATIPPLLATVFVASTGLSLDRLKRKRIVCTDSDAMKIAGKIKRAYFDKTGTLTRQGLEFLRSDCYEDSKSVDMSTMMWKAMATCHTLTLSSSGTFVGHFLDKVMFDASERVMSIEDGRVIVKKEGKDSNTITVQCRHEFDHHRMTQSVVLSEVVEGTVRNTVICKGSPEAIKMRCTRESLPLDYDDKVRKSSKEGIYQIAVGVRSLENIENIENMKRDELEGGEGGLSFLGFICFKNELREETPGMIEALKEGDIKPAIVTGDSVHTGIKIAQESGIIGPKIEVIVGQEIGIDGEIMWRDSKTDECVELPSQYDLARAACTICVNGEVWNYLLRMKMTHLIPYISVFGRCTPNDKVSIVDYSVRSGNITLFCGDGGNDCGALRTANIGIALSDAEASIVSPFTSLDKSISDVVHVLREGRCCLANSFASYKFMIIYGMNKVLMNFMIASFSVNFPLWNWFFADGFWLVTLGFSLPLSKAARKLAPLRPTSSLLGIYTMSSTLGVLVINVLFAVGAILLLTSQPFYQCRKWGSTDISNVRVIGDNYEAATIWLVCGPQIISAALTYNLGYRFRRAWFRNYALFTFIMLWVIIIFYIILEPSTTSCFFRVNCNNDDVVRGAFEEGLIPIQNAFNTTEMPKSYRTSIVFLIIGNFIANVGWEGLIVNGAFPHMAAVRKQKAEEQLLEELELEHKQGMNARSSSTDGDSQV